MQTRVCCQERRCTRELDLKRNDKFCLQQPSKKIKEKQRQVWEDAALVLNDEVGAAAPGLYATLANRAYWGQMPEDTKATWCNESPFRRPLLQVDSGDFGQLPPVPRGSASLMEAFLLGLDEYKDELRSRPLTDAESTGLRMFSVVAKNTIEFQGTYRFKPNDPLIDLLRIMRSRGGAKVPELLKKQVLSRVHAGVSDPRADPSYRFPRSVLNEQASDNNFLQWYVFRRELRAGGPHAATVGTAQFQKFTWGDRYSKHGQGQAAMVLGNIQPLRE